MTADTTNPYQPPRATIDKEKGDANSATSKRHPQVGRIVRAGLSIIAVVHFAGAMIIWMRWAPELRWDYLLSHASIAVVLFFLSTASLYWSLSKKRFAWLPVVAVYSISAGAFWYDVANERAQRQYNFAPVEYWENRGQKNVYYTWYCYNDGWFRRKW